MKQFPKKNTGPLPWSIEKARHEHRKRLLKHLDRRAFVARLVAAEQR